MQQGKDGTHGNSYFWASLKKPPPYGSSFNQRHSVIIKFINIGRFTRAWAFYSRKIIQN